jgi:hypothetical protein
MPVIKLKPCPFCGGDAEILPQPKGWLMARCRICSAKVMEFTPYKKQIAVAWNLRLGDRVATKAFKQICDSWIETRINFMNSGKSIHGDDLRRITYE